MTYVNFLEKYLFLNRNRDLDFRLYIHDLRKDDLTRIINFWSQKISIKPFMINLSRKHNVVTQRRFNLD
ncbi:hypothetical protein A2627_05170 [Candidatus Woesebacteria bacterium RIFCSPHIGHO2_01_FULL_39_28]|uniref:Uncharacterized protein n=1 Tax=Candidatus Woesebacteria bacterium RIFCSPHIGHO2_01_FULL_39_28 TaxID=1802496 RepID=A0A1F7YA41_9BACT|nr:MAG: hypothetical protein A2627_05170 [Candidatus Woesebacteria bacterium RIFCSPHIGHO2_01_FULL_39_28]